MNNRFEVAAYAMQDKIQNDLGGLNSGQVVCAGPVFQ